MPKFMLVAGRSSLSHIISVSLSLVLSIFLLAGCGDDDAPPTAPAPTGKITVTPVEPTVLVGDTLRFTATVQDIAPGVIWSLSAATATTDSLGTITQGGLYKAPVRVTSFFASKVRVRATSTTDANVFGETICTVPRITLIMTPGSYESVLPGSILPFQVIVANSHNPAYRAFVDGIENGDATVGTWTTTSNTTGIYMTAASEDEVINHQLFAKSVEDSTRFSLPSNVRVRGGHALNADVDKSQFSPEWSPTSEELAYVEGPPFKLMIYDAVQGIHKPIADVMWPGTVYDGRLTWRRDAARIAISEEVDGRRVIGLYSVTGADWGPFDPDPALEYLEAAYLPTDTADPDSLIVSVRGAGTSELRAYLASSAETGSGRLVYTPPSGREVRWPDAVRFSSQNWIAAVNQGAGTSDVISFKDDGEDTPRFVATGAGLMSHTSWSVQGFGYYWINYTWDLNQNFYRVNYTGSIPAARMYTDLFPQQSGDVSIVTADEHAVSRLEESGLHHIWIVEYPPRGFTGVPKAQELELESIGIRGAIQPNSWRRWLGDNPWGVRPAGR